LTRSIAWEQVIAVSHAEKIARHRSSSKGALLERNCAGRSVLAALDGWQSVVNWRHKFPNQGMQRGSLGVSFLIFVILAVSVIAWVAQ
jgi:hypothetical protein